MAAPPCGDGPAYTSLLDLTLLAGATLVAAPVPLVAPALRVYKGTAAIVPPGTGVPGLEPARIFAAGSDGGPLGGDDLLLLPRGGRRSGPEPPGPDQGDDDQQAAHVQQRGEAERGSRCRG